LNEGVGYKRTEGKSGFPVRGSIMKKKGRENSESNRLRKEENKHLMAL